MSICTEHVGQGLQRRFSRRCKYCYRDGAPRCGVGMLPAPGACIGGTLFLAIVLQPCLHCGGAFCHALSVALLRPQQATSRGVGWNSHSSSQSHISQWFLDGAEEHPRGLLPLQAKTNYAGSGLWHYTARTRPRGRHAAIHRKASLQLPQRVSHKFKSLQGGLLKALEPLLRFPTLAIKGLLQIFGAAPTNVRLEEVEEGLGGTLSIDQFEEKGRRGRLAWAVMALVAYIGIGFYYGKHEGWTITDACYFSVVTLSTVGYGDRYFDHRWQDEVLGGLYVFVGVAFIAAAAGELISQIQALAEKAAARHREQQLEADKVGLDLADQLRRGAAERQFESLMPMRNLRRQLVRSISVIVLGVLFGSLVMCRLEKWTLSYSFLWACVTSTTVGYGDQVPTTLPGKWFVMAYIMFSLGFVANALTCIARIPNEARRLNDTQRVLTQFGATLEAEELGALINSHEIQSMRTRVQALENQKCPSVSRTEFVLWLLVKTNKLNLQKDIGPCLQVFDTLDPDESGVLDQEDIDAFEQMRANDEIAAGNATAEGGQIDQ